MAEDVLTTDQVLQWLKRNPDLFQRHPELLDEIRIPHDAGTISLIEHQVLRLQQENRRLKRQLEQLSGIAGQNERLMQRLHQLTLDLMDSGEVRDFIERLSVRLGEDFKADRVRLHLVKADQSLHDLEAVRLLPESRPRWLNRLLDGSQPECGRLTRAKVKLLLGDENEQIASAALIPVPGQGVLAIGSTEPDRFYPDMGTLFLELLGSTIQYRLETLDDKSRKRA